MTERDTAPQAGLIASIFDEHEPDANRQARWENAAWAAGREVDRNALAVYMAVADAEQQALADSWAKTVAAHDAEIRSLKARVAELERPAIEAKRNEIRQSFAELIAQCEQDRDHEGAFDVQCRLREREEQWARDDAAVSSVV